MKYSFHPEAEAELNGAIDYYESCQTKLGFEFATAVYETIQRILSFPDAWAILDGNMRRCLVNRFPFGVVYEQKDDEVIILAVMQLNRKPGYWQDRV